MKIKSAISQAAAIVLIGAVAGMINNAFSVNGIDPFRKLDVPVFENAETKPGEQGREERDGICFVSLDEFREILDAGSPVLDARTSDEYESGHIPGAILCDYFELGYYLDSVLPRLSPEEEIAIYCSGPSCDDSEMLAKELYSLGYKKLCVFRGGMEEWIEAGLPLEHGAEEGWD
jgi:rhodanese-related sulfurtransferase